MINNMIKQILEYYNLKIGQHFYIDDIEYVFALDGERIYLKVINELDSRLDYMYAVYNGVAHLVNKKTIYKRPYTPKRGDLYYAIELFPNIRNIVSIHRFTDNMTDKLNLRIGNIFSTEDCALKHKNQVEEKFMEVLSW